jgi:hypothetical protein
MHVSLTRYSKSLHPFQSRRRYDSTVRTPRLLMTTIKGCGHTFCNQCINDKIKADGRGSLFKCPRDHRDTEVPGGTGIHNSIPPNTRLSIGIGHIICTLQAKPRTCKKTCHVWPPPPRPVEPPRPFRPPWALPLPPCRLRPRLPPLHRPQHAWLLYRYHHRPVEWGPPRLLPRPPLRPSIAHGARLRRN